MKSCYIAPCILTVDFDHLTAEEVARALSVIELTRASLSGVSADLNKIFLDSVAPDGTWTCTLKAQPELAEWVRKVGAHIKFPGTFTGAKSTDPVLLHILYQVRHVAVEASTKIYDALDEEHSSKRHVERGFFNKETKLFDYPYDVNAATTYPNEEYEYCYLPLLVTLWTQWTQYHHAREDMLNAIEYMALEASETSETPQSEPDCLVKARATLEELEKPKPVPRLNTWAINKANATKNKVDPDYTSSPTETGFNMAVLDRAETFFDAAKETNPWPGQPPFTREELTEAIKEIVAKISAEPKSV